MEAFKFAQSGISQVYAQESNVRRQLWLFVIGIGLALVLRISVLEIAMLVLAGGVIISLEFFNTALEKIEDLVWPEYREAVRFSKDAAAGAVLIASLATAIVAALIFIPAIARLLVY